MKITKVSVNRKFNLTNYESLDLSAEAELNETDGLTANLILLRESIEMTFIDMQRAKPTPTANATQQNTINNPSTATIKTPMAIANANQAKREASNICPNCGAFKKPEYPLCYRCNLDEKEKAGN